MDTQKNRTNAESATAAKDRADFLIEGSGSVYLFRPLNEKAREHLSKNIQSDAQWFGGALVVEHQNAAGLAEELRTNGYTVE
jgi:hypothetical protein